MHRPSLPVAVASLALAGAIAVPSPAAAQQGAAFREAKAGPGGVVATESYAAARVGRAVLQAHGNAVDAAAATVFALGVARPQSCGIGGGGFAVVRTAEGKVETLDFRETAPAAFTPGVFQFRGPHTEFTGHTTVGVPGVVAGMDALLERHGTISLRRAMSEAERLARRGFRVPKSLNAAAQQSAKRLALFPASAQLWLPGGQPPAAGSTFRNPELAATYRRIMRGGARAFYRGTIAKRIVRDMRAPRTTADPGLLTLKDLAAYEPVWRAPVRGSYGGADVFAMGPPTSGGIALVEALNVLRNDDLAGAGRLSAPTIHLVAEAQKIAFADRGAYVADPAFVPQPTAALTNPAYGLARRTEVDPTRAKSYGPGSVAGAQRRAGVDLKLEGSTTHLSVVDRRGAAVALTCTIEQEFGSAVVAPGTGFLLNNEMTDFSGPGTANEPAAGKRPRSSMSPTIVVRDGRPVLVVGGAGGARIPGGVLNVVLGMLEFGLPLDQALDAARWDAAPGTLEIEDGRVTDDVLADLQRRGHRLTQLGPYANRPRVNAAGWDAGRRTWVAAADPRTDDGALGLPGAR
ncbi:gamma-glutamyltransferase [Conexibacter sp. SYSU D00693]|uniref:gamma-glutamyltransferase n=1 Tax=Conexibacter sp. SYSU D00693 TaxID=2812560 RepID=UPI00196AE3B1|nr:gamma-glutamyltransferase [Conexibacter sp. SYSU D00693]